MTDQVISPLRRRMIEDMAIRKFAPKTQHDYVQRGTPLEAFGRRPPELVAPPVRGRHPKPFTRAVISLLPAAVNRIQPCRMAKWANLRVQCLIIRRRSNSLKQRERGLPCAYQGAKRFGHC